MSNCPKYVRRTNIRPVKNGLETAGTVTVRPAVTSAKKNGTGKHNNVECCWQITFIKYITFNDNQPAHNVRHAMTSVISFLGIDPFRLDFRACAMDWRVKSAGSRVEHISWVAGRAHSCISLVLVVVKTSHFTATIWAQKITAV